MTEFPYAMSDFPVSRLSIREPDKINCPKHGIHSYTIASTIEGHKGYWCQLCWLESLGEPLSLISEETSMADLSPAAQTVLDAYRSSHLSINNLAAALRAAVTHLAYKDAEGREFIYVPELINIAMELEGVND